MPENPSCWVSQPSKRKPAMSEEGFEIILVPAPCDGSFMRGWRRHLASPVSPQTQEQNHKQLSGTHCFGGLSFTGISNQMLSCSQWQKELKWAAKEGRGNYCFMGQFQFEKTRDSGDGCIKMWMCLMPLNCTVQNGLNGKQTNKNLYVYFTKIFKRKRNLGNNWFWNKCRNGYSYY